MPLILGTNSIKDTGYDVANSLRFNSGSSDFLNRTPSSASNRKTFTFSFWIKRTKFGVNHTIYNVRPDSSGANRISFHSTTDTFRISLEPISKYIFTKRKFRDPSSWYHFVLAFDTTQSTASDRVKIYINGVQETELVKGDGGAATYPDQDTDLDINRDVVIQISKDLETSSYFVDGYLAEFVFIDGTALDQTSFGEFDSDSPNIWKPIDVSGLTFGTNGFYLDFENASSLGADVSGNSNNFTVNNLTSIDQSTDTCTNNFATLNPLGHIQQGTLSEGNLKVTSSSSYKIAPSTIAVSSGKWYVEHKITGSSPDVMVGIISVDDYNANPGNINYAGDHANSVGYYKNGKRWIANGAVNYGATFTTDDIIGIALDLDSGTKTITFYKNGASQGSINLPSNDNLDYYFLPSPYNRSIEINFGSPSYSISSGNADDNGYGNFEYSPPSGYYSINTKNLAEFG